MVPCGITATLSDEKKKGVYDACDALVKELKAAGIKSKADCRENYSPGWKFFHWELKVWDVDVFQEVYQNFRSRL